MMRLHFSFFLLFAAMMSGAYASPVSVDSAAALEQAVAAARPGDEILVAAGTHESWSATLAGKGAAEQPIVIGAEKEGETVFTGATHLRLTGSHIVLSGLAFRDGSTADAPAVNFDDAQHCRLTACRFQNTQGRDTIFFRKHASDNRVDHCSLLHTVGRCLVILISQEHLPQRNRIDHNLFEDVPAKGGNGRETIQIGQNQPAYGLLEPATVVEYNVFRRCDGESEIISNKSSRNIYRGNLFQDCKGALVMRGGSHCLIEGNRFENCSGGVRLHGTHHTVTGNVIVGCGNVGIVLPYGMQRPLGSLYQATGNCLIAHNTIVNTAGYGIHLGANRDRDLLLRADGTSVKWNYEKHGKITKMAEAPYDNRILNNIVTGTTGTLIRVEGSPGNEIARNLLYPVGKAQMGTSGEEAVTADPMFADAASGDYTLLPASPARTIKPISGGEAGLISPPDALPHTGASGQRPPAGPGF